MEKFLALTKKKQDCIIDAGLSVFGKMSYKKASVQDIAQAAGISKAMIFHYFGSKKSMYLFLLKYAGDFIMQEIEGRKDLAETTDFFEWLKLGAKIKVETVIKHPYLMAFFMSVYFETDAEVAAEIKVYLSDIQQVRMKLVKGGTDTSKFKEGIDSKLVINLLMWAAEGYANQIQRRSGITNKELEVFLRDFNACVDLMRDNFYK